MLNRLALDAVCNIKTTLWVLETINTRPSRHGLLCYHFVEKGLIFIPSKADLILKQTNAMLSRLFKPYAKLFYDKYVKHTR